MGPDQRAHVDEAGLGPPPSTAGAPCPNDQGQSRLRGLVTNWSNISLTSR
jgi:hypothetical protein